MRSNDPPHAVVELDEELYDFLIRNCETNRTQMLAVLDPVRGLKLSRETASLLVDMIEKFKRLQQAAERGRL